MIEIQSANSSRNVEKSSQTPGPMLESRAVPLHNPLDNAETRLVVPIVVPRSMWT